MDPMDWSMSAGTLIDLLLWHRDDTILASRGDLSALSRLALTSVYSREQIRGAADLLAALIARRT